MLLQNTTNSTLVHRYDFSVYSRTMCIVCDKSRAKLPIIRIWGTFFRAGLSYEIFQTNDCIRAYTYICTSIWRESLPMRLFSDGIASRPCSYGRSNATNYKQNIITIRSFSSQFFKNPKYERASVDSPTPKFSIVIFYIGIPHAFPLACHVAHAR
jgi:hypothetical protein